MSVPELEPVFNYTIIENGEGIGDIYVYLIKSEIAEFAIMTYDDTSDEFAYAVQTMTGFANLDAESLVSKAALAWEETPNPFRELKNDYKAMRKLAEILNEASRVSENEE